MKLRRRDAGFCAWTDPSVSVSDSARNRLGAQGTDNGSPPNKRYALSNVRRRRDEPLAEVERIDHDGWAEVVLNRPERRNAINGALGEQLAATFQAVEADADVHAVLFRGAGGSFCSGLDLKAFNAEPAPVWVANFGTIWRDAHKAIFNCSKPIIAALERFAINGGAALALAADLLIAGETAYLHVGEVRMGMAAPYNIAWLRLRHSEHLAATLALTGRRFPGTELSAMGLALRSVADSEVVAEARALTEELATFPPGAGKRIKSMLRAYGPEDADAWFDRATRQTGAQVPSGPRLSRTDARNQLRT